MLLRSSGMPHCPGENCGVLRNRCSFVQSDLFVDGLIWHGFWYAIYIFAIAIYICHLSSKYIVLPFRLTYSGRVTLIYVSKLTIFDSDNGLSGRCQAIIWTNAAIFLIRLSGTKLSEILFEIYTFSFKKMHLKI